MEGIILDKRQFCWLNDNDAYSLFRKEIKLQSAKLSANQQILYGLDGYVQELNGQLFDQFQHIIVTPENTLFGYDGLSYHYIQGENLTDIYHAAIDIKSRDPL